MCNKNKKSSWILNEHAAVHTQMILECKMLIVMKEQVNCMCLDEMVWL